MLLRSGEANSRSMAILGRFRYLQRVFAAYVLRRQSQLTFWHDVPEVNENFEADRLGEYYMPFLAKADFPGVLDPQGIPMLNYHGRQSLQYNPIAVAQYGLGNYNLFRRTGSGERRTRFLAVADWLVENLELNSSGLSVWNHHFDWEYRTKLVAPWFSGLAQGQGISVLARAHAETGDQAYLDAAHRAFEPFGISVDEGGVAFVDSEGNTWIEEYIVSPPTHILNGFIWASWGVYDYFLVTGSLEVKALFDSAVRTIAANLTKYDLRYWSLYEQSGTKLPMVASPFYHRLHITQLRVMYRLTGEERFNSFADRWESYLHSRFKRTVALFHKAIFKLFYY